MATNQRPIPAATRRPLQRRRRLSIAVPVLIMSSLIRLSSGFTTISSGLRRTVSNASFRRRPHHPSSSSLPSPAARMRWMHPMHSMSRPLTVSSKPSYLSAVASSSINTETDTVDLPYTDHSPPDFDPSLPPALILHGLLGSKRNFASLAASLAVQLRQKRRIIAVDLRNHGENQRESWRDDMSYRSMARDVMGVMDGEGLEEAVLIGHSMGGKVAKAAALLHPERVAGLVVMDIAPVEYKCEDPHWGSVKETIRSIVGVSLEECEGKRDVDVALRHAVADPALRAFVLTNLDECRETGALSWKINIEAIARQLNDIAGFDVAGGDGMRETESGLVYNGDTLFIKGGASKFVQNTHVDTISSYFPNYLLTSIRSAGHWVHAEAPEDTLAMIKKYLDR